MPQEEQVLVFERKVLDKRGTFHGLNFDVEQYLRDIFAPGILRFMPRPKAEADPATHIHKHSEKCPTGKDETEA